MPGWLSIILQIVLAIIQYLENHPNPLVAAKELKDAVDMHIAAKVES